MTDTGGNELMEKNDGTEKREQEGQPEGEGNHGAQAPQAQEAVSVLLGPISQRNLP